MDVTGGFTMVPNAFLTAQDVGPTHKLVWICIAMMAPGRSAVARVAHATIARNSGLSRSRVCEIIRDLEDLGYLRKSDETDARGLYAYTLVPRPRENAVLTSAPDVRRVDTPCRQVDTYKTHPKNKTTPPLYFPTPTARAKAIEEAEEGRGRFEGEGTMSAEVSRLVRRLVSFKINADKAENLALHAVKTIGVDGLKEVVARAEIEGDDRDQLCLRLRRTVQMKTPLSSDTLPRHGRNGGHQQTAVTPSITMPDASVLASVFRPKSRSHVVVAG